MEAYIARSIAPASRIEAVRARVMARVTLAAALAATRADAVDHRRNRGDTCDHGARCSVAGICGAEDSRGIVRGQLGGPEHIKSRHG